jgi:hypothetical protein
MSAQVAQVKQFHEQIPARAVQGAQLPQINFNHHNHVPSAILIRSQWDTYIGNLNNEYRQRRRHRYRLSKNNRTLHCPYKWAKDRLRTLVPFT